MDEKLKYKIRSAVEKLGLVQSLNMFGKDVIKQVYFNTPSLFLKQYNNLNPVEVNNIIYYVDTDNLPLFCYDKDEQNSKNGYYWVNYYRIWAFFSEVMDYSFINTQGIMMEWLDTTYNLRELTPIGKSNSISHALDTTYNLRELTPGSMFGTFNGSWEQPII